MRNKLDELYPVCIDHYSKDIEQRRLFKEFNYGKPYVHKCIYCGDYFMCKHQSQKYCPEKFGKEDHCRREQEKRLKSERDSVTNQKRHNIEINEAIISKIMNGQGMKVVLPDELNGQGYIESAYNGKLKGNKSKLFHHDYYHLAVECICFDCNLNKHLVVT